MLYTKLIIEFQVRLYCIAVSSSDCSIDLMAVKTFRKIRASHRVMGWSIEDLTGWRRLDACKRAKKGGIQGANGEGPFVSELDAFKSVP